MSKMRTTLLTGTIIASFTCIGVIMPAWAEDCTGPLPGVDCTIDENTTAPLTIDNGVTLTVGGSISIDHAIDGSAAIGDGDISTTGIGNNITQNADIGGTTPIDSLSIRDDNTWTTNSAINTNNDGTDIDLGAADGGETLNFISGSSYVGEIDGNATDVVDFGSDGNGGTFTTGGQIEAVTVNLTSGTLNVNNNLGGGIALNSLSINNNAILNSNANITVGGALDVDGQVSIDAGNSLSADTYVVDGDDATFIIGVENNAGTNQTGRLNITNGGPLDLSSDNIIVTIDPTSQPLQTGTVANIVVGNGGATIGPNSFSDTSYLYDFNLQNNGDNLDLEISVNDLDAITTTSNNAAIATAILQDMADSEAASINAVQAALGNDSTESTFNERLESLAPSLDAGYAQVSRAHISQVEQAIHHRAVTSRYNAGKFKNRIGNNAVLSSGSQNLITGKIDRKKHQVPTEKYGNLWAKAYIQNSSKSKVGGIDGFGADATGVIIGADKRDRDNNMIFGAALVVGTATIDSDNANKTKNSADSFGFSIYTSKNLKKDTLLSGSFSYLYNDHNNTRYAVGGLSGSDASAEFTSQHIALTSSLSKQYLRENGLHIRPNMNVAYNFISAEQYREVGADALSLNVDYEGLHTLSMGAGVEAGKLFKTDEGLIVYPTVHLAYQYDILDTRVKSVTGLGSSVFSVEGEDPSRHNIDAGVDVVVTNNEKWQLDAGYNLSLDEDTSNHTFGMKMAYGF